MSRGRRKANSNTPEGPYVMRSLAMMTSPAWRALSRNDKGVLEALEIEHMKHGGTRNGRLVQTYDQLAKFVSKRQGINQSLMRLEALGFIEVKRAGYVRPGAVRPANRYRLTYVAGRDDVRIGETVKAPIATHDWCRLETEEAVAAVLASHKLIQPSRSHADGPPENYRKKCLMGTGQEVPNGHGVVQS